MNLILFKIPCVVQKVQSIAFGSHAEMSIKTSLRGVSGELMHEVYSRMGTPRLKKEEESDT